MYWLNMNWITGNWAPLLVALVLGYVLGWLLTGMSPARRARDLEARNADLEGKQRKSEREVADMRSDSTKIRSSLTTALADLEAARDNAKSLAEKVAALEAAAVAEPPTEEMPAVDAAGRGVADEGAGDTPATELTDGEAEEADDAAMVKATIASALAPDQIAESFATVARTPEAIEAENAREVALKEAIGRAARLQEELDRRDTMLSAHHAELESLKAELLTSNAARHELDNRLVRAREDVASELAVLASTMIKMKDDALTRADARNAALKAELEATRAELDAAHNGQPSAAE